MFYGRYKLGQEAQLWLACTAAHRLPAVPDEAPGVRVYAPVGTKVLSAVMPVADRYGATGVFCYPFRLGNLALGRYRVALAYRVGGAHRLQAAHFDVLPGGSPHGAVVALYHYERPHARFLVMHTDSGERFFGRNPA